MTEPVTDASIERAPPVVGTDSGQKFGIGTFAVLIASQIAANVTWPGGP